MQDIAGDVSVDLKRLTGVNIPINTAVDAYVFALHAALDQTAFTDVKQTASRDHAAVAQAEATDAVIDNHVTVDRAAGGDEGNVKFVFQSALR
ncbi:hypothetical protein BSU04_33570 [Caballeronia sordidicola]|uniref:Uncharacterized protein n=1 Tax=Caballeronia sordidicola TaxID=196367 RepID=A0A226WTI5_CABSO|nr:hypothetical protein BSU04_33570 [Caballeronia sordidicola]